MKGVNFTVSSDHFVTMKGGDSVQQEERISTSSAYLIWKIYYHFMSEKLVAYEASQHLYRAMPFVDPSKDHRLDSPLWRRVAIAISTICVAAFILRHLLRIEREKPAYHWNPLLKGQVKEL